MARFLICAHPITGHVNPSVEIARALVERGHEVKVYTGLKFKAKIERVGAQFAPMTLAYDYDDADYDAAFPGRSSHKGLAQIKFDFKHIFIEQGPAQAEDLREILRRWPAVVVSDPGFVGAKLLHDLGELPQWAVVNIGVLGLPSTDVPPFGIGMLPNYSALGKLRNRVISFVANKIVFRDVNAFLRSTRATMGLPREQFSPMFSDQLYLQPSIPAIEYARSDLPQSVHFVGAVLPQFTGEFDEPSWWSEVVDRRKPVVVVTQGTVATDGDELIAPTLRALADQDVLVVATTGGKELPRQVPANARVEKFVPFDELMQHADVLITNGGYGGVMFALSHGVPVICAGTTEDKPEVGNRMAYSGVGLNLKTNRPTDEQILDSVHKVLGDNAYRTNAQRIAGELAKHDGPAEAATLLERLALTEQPVVRGDDELRWASVTH
ncbi:glycosyltransferase [Antrihabitans stalactiti]|uniref:Glycosyltransferase n=1 Tax=Antrihabitans stalactiti TaxID=2584121 RepID=A0A848KIN0_9NOCA|nr:nucleotide disphospho-sugar-binding domain-containing protein [Antrihabitans stalactiti]NMN98933.1 glycosyltransferase [Antrihabitans stalactiti]